MRKPKQERGFAHFEDNPESVFYSRQLEVIFEREYFHWVTNRALRGLVAEGRLISEVRRLDLGSEIKLIWNRKYRFYKRAAGEVYDLVNRYSNSASDGTLGLQGEHLVLHLCTTALPPHWGGHQGTRGAGMEGNRAQFRFHF